MSPFISLFSLVFSLLFSWLSYRTFIPFLRLHLVDIPNHRSSHVLPTPRGGGIVFVLISCSASVLYSLLNFGSTLSFWPLLLAPLLCLPLSVVGFLDDLYSLPAYLRYFVQLFTALVVLYVSPLNVPSFLFPSFAILLLVIITAVINFTNFMDGLDGLVGGCMAVVMTVAAIKLTAPWPTWILVGALLGFLLWNWSPAKIFMGDVGSTFLGSVFALFVLQSNTWSDAFGLMLVSTPLLSDGLFCVIRRLMNGQPVFQAHRVHLFQRLHQSGMSHSRVSCIYITATAVLAVPLLLDDISWMFVFVVLELMIGFWLDQRVAVPFSLASRS
jgi:Fuc2NAc and GlcNAc transferase